MTKRLLAGLALLFSAIFLPWWLSLPLMLCCSLSFNLYLEGIVLAALLDLIYGAPVPRLYGFQHAFLAAGLLIFAFASFARSRMVSYRA